MKHKKRTYRKEQPKETLVVWDILKNETVAFLDTEYVTTQQKYGRPAKLVSVGMVICRGDFEEVDRFHSYIHMDGELHDKVHNRLRRRTRVEKLSYRPAEQAENP